MVHKIRRHYITHCPKFRRFAPPSRAHAAGIGAVVHIRQLPSQTKSSVIFSGIQPTGVPHLGNYLGALQQWTRLQEQALPSDQLLYSVVDLHAITVQQDARQLRRRRRETLAALLAVGLNPERSTIFYQSAVPEHTELMWILSCSASVGSLSRMTQWKSKLALLNDDSALDFTSTRARLRLGLFSYPVLQAADILLYGTTHVPVGEDQVQHLEFTRDCVDTFNAIYGEVLVKPRIVLSSAKRVMSLKDPRLKMSKSHQDARSRIHINDQPECIATKLQLALTDSKAGVSYDPINRPGVSNLLAIMSYLDGQGRGVEELAQSCSAMTMRELKYEATAIITEGLAGIRERYDRLLASDDAHYLEDIALEGSNNARQQAKKTITVIRKVVGL